MKDKILVIGGTGNIGLPLIKELIQKDCNVVAGVHNIKRGKQELADIPVEIRKFDFLEPKTFGEALRDVSRVFFVRPPQLANPKEDMYPFLDYLKLKTIQQIVFVSLIGVEKNPLTPHHKIEKRIEQLSLPYTFIRPSFFMQNLNTTHQNDIKQNHDLFIPAGNSKTSFIDTRDIAAVAAECLTDERYLGQKLALTGEFALTYTEIAEIMTSVLEVPITYSRPSLLKFRKTMLARGTEKEYVNVMVMLYLITQLGNAKAVTPTVKAILGRDPISFKQYVKDYRASFI